MKYQLLLMATLFVARISFAQNTFLEGYIIKASGDTLKGYIKEDMDSHLAEKVSFKLNASGEAATYSVKDIRGFGFQGTIFRALNYFDEADSIQKEKFGKLLVEGYYTLYALYFGVGDHNFLVISREGKNFFLYDDVLRNTVEGSTKGNYRNHLYFIGQACPEVMNRVETMTFAERNVARFVQDANNCLEPGSKSSIHIKKAKTKYKGVYLFAGGIPLGKNGNQVMGQLMARFVSPAITQNASLNIGIEYTRYGSPTTTKVYTLSSQETHYITELYGVPIQLQYNFTRGWFQPYGYVGVGIVYKRDRDYLKYNDFGTVTYSSTNKLESGASFPLGIGVEIYPTSNLIIKADLRYELFLQYPAIGLAYKF